MKTPVAAWLPLLAAALSSTANNLSEDRNIDVKFGSDDLAALFEPLPA